MTYVVSITSQGQISIPAPLRRQFNLNVAGKASVFVQDGKIVVEPIPDLLSLGGSLSPYAKNAKGKTFRQMREEYGKYQAKRADRKDNFPFPHKSLI